MDAIRAEPDLRRKVRAFADGLAQRQARSAKVQLVIRDGRHVDAALEPIWAKVNEEGLLGMAALANLLFETGQVRPGLEVDEVRDLLWNYLAIDHYERLVLQRGWTLTRYARWLGDAMVSAVT